MDKYAKVEPEKQKIMPKRKTAKLNGENARQIFTTIDDLILLARELLIGLSTLGEYKYPLGVRKGVRKLKNERESMTIKAIGRMYFLDLKETKDGNPFLVITESRSQKEGETRERSSILVFKENAQEFAEAVSSMVAKISD